MWWPTFILFLYVHWLSYMCNASKLSTSVYTYFPNQLLSHCTRRLNATNQVGCSSQPGKGAGIATFMFNSTVLIDLLNKLSIGSPNRILLIDSHLFINVTLMARLRSKEKWIAGLVVLGPSSDSDVTLPNFSESNTCPNSRYSYYGPERQCDVVNPMWNMYGTDYSSIEWPFPVVLLRHEENSTVMSALKACYQDFNTKPMDDTRCMVEISNEMSGVQSSTVCVRRQLLMSVLQSESPPVYCKELTGVNIVLGLTNTTVATDSMGMRNSTKSRPVNSTILVLTRLDSRSMFERSGFASQGILPSVAVLVSAAVHLMNSSAVKNRSLARDLFFVFLDNEAYDFMGSGRFNFDMHWGHLATYTGSPLYWENVHSVIEMGLLVPATLNENSTVPTYFLQMDKDQYTKTMPVTDELIKQMQKASTDSGKLIFKKPPNEIVDLPLPPTASLQMLLSQARRPLPHLIITGHAGPPLQDPYFESFLDTEWPPLNNPTAPTSLLDVSNALADALHRLITPNGESIEKSIVEITPGELMQCFVNNPNCSLLQTFLSPHDISFLSSLGTPIPTQSYIPLNGYELKISHIINVLLMGLTGERTATRECPTDADESYAYFMGYYNGHPQCYQTLLNIADEFFLYLDGKPVNPGWIRSNLLTGSNFMRWYRDSSIMVDAFGLTFGMLITVLSVICAFLLRNMQDIQNSNSVRMPPVELVQIDNDRNTDSNTMRI